MKFIDIGIFSFSIKNLTTVEPCNNRIHLLLRGSVIAILQNIKEKFKPFKNNKKSILYYPFTNSKLSNYVFLEMILFLYLYFDEILFKNMRRRK